MAMSTNAIQAQEAQKADTTRDTTNATNTTATAAAAAAPRKRRRRAPATGASEDCFACRKRGVKCDRRRPYCGQCIELGKECSGYRTTLTWGVGVASRGKLRGLSLPVAKSSTQNASTTRDSKTQTTTATTVANPTVTAAQRSPTRIEPRGSIDYGVHSPTSPASPHSFSGPQEYHYFGPTSPIPIPSPSTPMGFAVPGYGEHVDPFHPHSSKLRRPHLSQGPLQRLHTSLAVPYEDNGLSASSASLGSYGESDYPSPGEYPRTPAEEYPFMDSSSMPRFSNVSYHDQQSIHAMEHIRYHSNQHALPMADDLSSSISSDQSVRDFNEVSSAQQSMGPPAFPDIFIEGEMSSSLGGLSQHGFHYLPSEGTSSYGSGPLSIDELALTTFIPQNPTTVSHLSPRMLYLLDYYDKFISQVLVAGDGPTNPYRMHVMPLAMRSEGLRNAIAALATNNLRMRGGIEGRRLSYAQDYRMLPEHAFSQMTTWELREMHGEPSDEEKHYKAQSITHLNQKLVDPQGAQDDSVLATLLILCLFHVCDSGFTKFRTQLAGVQKLLSMRDRTVRSDFIDWIEFFFTWFDVLTSAVNDREMEVQGESLDMMNLTANLGAAEHLSGCEGRLFKLIARLGRLNLLSQNRPVRENDTTPRTSPRLKRRDTYVLAFNSIDGNGWRPSTAQRDSGSYGSGAGTGGHRADFWEEWHDVRVRLQEWEFEHPLGHAPAGMLSPADTALLHMSESFRYAALLYTERLAHPTLSSAALNFQSLVSQGLFHISQIGITSCVNKFLLWPLFLIGTECVQNEHRAIVRQRCVEIQRESGFFNNLSGLEVLEKVWQEDVDAEAHLDVKAEGWQTAPPQAFRWRKAMDRVDGEYIMI
ncbi:hypothetical protein P171DRAFT_471485 [Karstenula rhodostoma CBS 690.94]|uniref:Zn(2)-C6 fungal-type domain-containing protein n=1 Tax=Karstenula rhodostoma CBS 690.94 TaxID=1392251 RepID=A0A9P4UEG5_9PLEO|nr:hypothetical protein P171DRAFT_471485 [Karstenula rhodostoma CBS 690.94]